MNELTTTEKKEILPQAKSFLEHAQEDLRDIGNRYFMLGCRLWEARRYHYVEALGYESIEQLAEKEFDLGKSSTYNLINIFDRFSERGERGQRKAWIDPKYQNYKYSQLIEMEKAMCLPDNIEKEIPPATPVRVIKEFIKYLNKNPGHHKTLPEWQAEQEKQKQIEQLPLVAQIPEAQEPPANKSDELDFDTWLENQPEGTFVQGGGLDNNDIEPVQTFGLQECAKPKYETPIIKIRPEYNFHTRTGARAFLADYENWKKYSHTYNGIFFKNVYGYTFKNKKYIMACERELFENPFDINITLVQPIYFLSADYGAGLIEISQNQFEKYCAEHKDEL